MATYLKHTISYGDTLQNIAQDRLGDADRWVEVAMINNLVFPFIVDFIEDKQEGVKVVGEDILVPLDGDNLDVVPSDVSDIYEKALGEDLSLFGDNELIVISKNEIGEFYSDVYGDLKTVRGLKNLRQAYILRLSTPLGSLLHHPNYGSIISELVGKKSTSGVIHKVKIEVERVIRSDARTEDIRFEQITLDGDTIVSEVIIQPVGFDVAFKMSLIFGEGGLIEWA